MGVLRLSKRRLAFYRRDDAIGVSDAKVQWFFPKLPTPAGFPSSSIHRPRIKAGDIELNQRDPRDPLRHLNGTQGSSNWNQKQKTHPGGVSQMGTTISPTVNSRAHVVLLPPFIHADPCLT